MQKRSDSQEVNITKLGRGEHIPASHVVERQSVFLGQLLGSGHTGSHQVL